jgi:phenylpyruvate tautomerase PptA (4-oxalocrotonate tautomerase family)
MPVYQCSVSSSRLDDAKRQQIASEITRIHCESTGAPPDFAHVLFADAPEGAGPGASVLGSIRAGRPDALKARMAAAIAEAVAKTIGEEPQLVRVHLLDVPASWVMEGGVVLPEPGEEADWLARHGQTQAT